MSLRRGNPVNFPGQQGFSGPMNYPPSSPGTLRDTLGSALKSRGIFQKDGQIHNLRGGFIGPKKNSGLFPNQGHFPGGAGFPPPNMQGFGKSRQFILQASQPGFAGNGIVTISPDNTVNIVANLPAPNTLFGQSGASYVAYLVDEKGKSGFPLGHLRSVGNGVYQVSYHSQVPLNYFNKAIITVENGYQLSRYPSGPIVLQAKRSILGGAGAFLAPIGKGAKSIWGKITGFIGKRGKKSGKVIAPDENPSPEFVQSLKQMGINEETPPPSSF